jgi:two-component system CheB/CheR fusion protein
MRDSLFVAITGFGLDADRRRSREAGFDHHLVKPVEPELLRALLEDARLTRVEPACKS